MLLSTDRESIMQLDHQRMLLPEVMRLLVSPRLALGAELEVEVVQDTSHNHAVLLLGHVTARARAGTNGERLANTTSILEEGRR